MKIKTNIPLLISGLVLLGGLIMCKTKNNDYLRESVGLFRRIDNLYGVEKSNLFHETYPFSGEQKVDYLAKPDDVSGDKVAYLWPYSSVLSANQALLKTEYRNLYLRILNNRILPGLESYYDTTRVPAAYQSYIKTQGASDRYYDDNIWIAIDFCELFKTTGNSRFLEKAESLWKFIYSGWDNKLNGGIYWCEQKKGSKNTCSNAPAAVLACKLFQLTDNQYYLKKAMEIYEWTKQTFQDKNDFLYFDKQDLQGKTDSTKYAYNSGQMMQAASLLYKTQGDPQYYSDAKNIAQSAIKFFTNQYSDEEFKKIRLFKNNTNWFTTVMFRGFYELWTIDKRADYLKIFKQNMDVMLSKARDKDGLFAKYWSGGSHNKQKWLLDQAGLVELLALLSAINE